MYKHSASTKQLTINDWQHIARYNPEGFSKQVRLIQDRVAQGWPLSSSEQALLAVAVLYDQAA